MYKKFTIFCHIFFHTDIDFNVPIEIYQHKQTFISVCIIIPYSQSLHRKIL